MRIAETMSKFLPIYDILYRMDDQDSTPRASFKSIEEQLQELDEHLSTQLQKQEQLKSEVQAPQDSENSESPHLAPGADPDESTQEFIQLADFISKERNKKAPTSKDPQKVEKIGKLQKYKKIKTKEFESLARQKGLQINKAA